MLPSVRDTFRFVVMRQNRRVLPGDGSRNSEIEEFHAVLNDVAHCSPTPKVAEFLIQAYGKGALTSAKRVEYEGNTSIFTKRRYRDAWNRSVMQRLAKQYPHALTIEACCRASYAKDARWFGQKRNKWIRSKVRTQAPWKLQLAGCCSAGFPMWVRACFATICVCLLLFTLRNTSALLKSGCTTT